MTDGSRKVIVFAFVAAAHVAAVVLIEWIPQESALQLQPEPEPEVEAIFIALASEAKRRKQPAARSEKAYEAEASAPSREQNEVEASAEPEAVPAIDWDGEVSRASEAALTRQMQKDALRPLISKPKTLTPTPEVVEPGIFTLTPSKPPGTFEDLGEGITREWVAASADKVCYWWSDMGPNGRVPRKKCLPKFANRDNGDLFKKFRPKYLDIHRDDLQYRSQDGATTAESAPP